MGKCDKKKHGKMCKALEELAKHVSVKHHAGFHPFIVVFIKQEDDRDEFTLVSADPCHPVTSSVVAAMQVTATKFQ